MDRRRFFTTTGAGAAAMLAAPEVASAAAKAKAPAGGACASAKLPPLKAKLGHEIGRVNDKNLSFLARYGLNSVGASADIADPARLYPTADEMKKLRDMVNKHGFHLELTAGPLLPSSNIDREKNPNIMLAHSPERDREIEAFQNHIRSCAAAGVPTLKYNMSILGVVRSGTVHGRGDTLYNKWNVQDALKEDLPLTRAGVVNAEAFWERIDYFLSHVVPVANEYKVRIACHPQDPGMPQPEGYRGVDRVLGTVDGLKKFVTMHESPYHGLNFCQGTVSEDLEHPNDEIGEVVRWFGSRNKIFNVHFRNIRGHRGDFVAEMFPDEGDVDFVKVLKVYREVGYDRMLMPDHAPRVPGNPNAINENFAFEWGFIRGLIMAEQHIV